MTDDEKFVRESWERVLVCDGSYRHYVKGTILINWANHQFYEFGPGDWSAARAFTEERLEQIRQIEEEIHLIEGWRFTVEGHPAAKRILARLTEQRDALKKGMRQ